MQPKIRPVFLCDSCHLSRFGAPSSKSYNVFDFTKGQINMLNIFKQTRVIATLKGYILETNICKMSQSTAPVEAAIRNKLSSQLETSQLEVINESYMHNVPKGSETHFKVVVVSEKFNELPLIKRHRMVNDILKHELENGVHALSIVAKTPSQWDTSDQKIEPSPNCRGGFGK